VHHGASGARDIDNFRKKRVERVEKQAKVVALGTEERLRGRQRERFQGTGEKGLLA
jgi:hypothetical protein